MGSERPLEQTCLNLAVGGVVGGAGGPRDLVVKRLVSRFGLRGMHVIRGRMQVDREKYLVQVEDEARGRGMGVEWQAFVEWLDETGFWHLWLYWKEVDGRATG